MKNSTLIYCLDVLKIKEDSEVYRNAQKLPIESENKWISATKIIANASVGYTFSQSQLSDFLTLAAKSIEHTNTSSDTIVFKIYRDIIENYDYFSESLKSNYPRIIVDVISTIINHDSIVNPIIIEKYYQLKKQEAAVAKKGEEHLGKTLNAPSFTTAAAIHKEKLPLSNDELIQRLVQITNRDRISLQKAVERLPYSDLKKISELCRNYSKLQYYGKLIAKEGSRQELKNNIQREIGREIRSDELGHAVRSIRKVQTYIGNILDNKFTLDSSHGINHIKHNLEYGYRLMNLIELPRRRRHQ
ncbi:MAG TPA: hypothetical protein VE643_06710 [Nitrososphaeraceae archaeon]|nr:hypothetical protein [Nitrososphaeraceae archaeon]